MDQNAINEKKARRALLNKQNSERRRAEQDALIAAYPPAAAAVGQEVQFFHDMYHGKTVAVVAPTGDELRAAAMRLLGNGKEIAINVMLGEAQVNALAGDQYNRRIGRAVSTSKMSLVSMKLSSANIYENVQHYTLELGKLSLDFTIQKNPNVPYLGNVNERGLRSLQSRKRK